MSVQIQNEDYIFEYVSSFRTAQKQGLRVGAHRLVTLKNEVYTYVSAIVFFRATHCVTLRKRNTPQNLQFLRWL